MTRQRRRIVYTALMGDYEALNEQPVARHSGVEFVCFSDNADVRSETWTVRHIDARFPQDPVRSARVLKTAAVDLFPDHDESLWIDNSVILEADPEIILDAWLESSDVAAPRHDFRQSVLAEFDAVLRGDYDDPHRVFEQLRHYAATEPSTLNDEPYWTALLARRHTPDTGRAMRLWADHILRYSRRDQLSFNQAMAESGQGVASIDLPSGQSGIHHWPVRPARKWDRTTLDLGSVLGVPALKIGELQNRVDELTAELQNAQHDSARLEVVARERREAEERERHRGDALRAEYENSSSWRLTAPLRAVGRLARKARKR